MRLVGSQVNILAVIVLQPIVLLFGGSNRDENRHQTDFCPLKQGTAAQFVIGGYSFRFCMRFQILMFLRF